jgi:F-type H+-transporting ATPase subunit b
MPITILANTESHSPSIFEALGLNWTLLIEQAIAFLILVWILGKFVYPVLIKSIDTRREQIEAGLKEAQESRVALEQAEAKVEEALAQARADADAILARSHQEAGAMIAEAEAKAKQHAEQIVKDARMQLETDVRKARDQLKADTVSLVAAATEKVIDEKLDAKKDASLISKALKQEQA